MTIFRFPAALLLTISLINTAKSDKLYSLSTDIITSFGDNGIYPGTYASSSFSFLVDSTFDLSFGSFTNVTFHVTLPHSAPSQIYSCPRHYTDGQSFDCSDNKPSALAEVSLHSIDVTYGKFLNSTSPPKISQNADHEVLIEIEGLWTDTDYTSNVTAMQEGATITIEMAAFLYPEAEHSLFEFQANLSTGTESLDDAISVYRHGAYLVADYIIHTVDSDVIESGGLANYTITVGHSGISTEDATNVKVHLKLESLTDYSLLDGTGLRTRSGSSPITFSMDSSDDEKTFNLGTLAENENFTLEFTLEASELPLNDHMIVSVEIEFDDSEVDYQFWTSGSISTEHVDLTHDTSDVFLPAGIPAGHILEIQKTFRMPIGYADIYFFSYIDAGDLGEVPIKFLNASLQAPNWVIVEQQMVATEDFEIYEGSHLANESETHNVTAQFLKVENNLGSGMNGTNLTLVVYYVCGEITHEGDIFMQTAIGINTEEYYMNNVDVIVFNPNDTLLHSFFADIETLAGDYNGYRATYPQQKFDMTIQSAFNVTNDLYLNVYFEIKVPHRSYTVLEDCVYDIYGNVTGCQEVTKYKAFIDIKDNLLHFDLSPGLTYAQYHMSLLMDHILLVELEGLQALYNYGSDDDGINDNGTISISVPGKIDINRNDDEFDIEYRVYTNLGESNTTALTLKRLGPILSVSDATVHPSNGVEAGDTINYNIQVDHQQSTEDALAVQIALDVETSNMAPFVSGSLQYTTVSTSGPLPDSDLNDIAAGTISLSDHYIVEFDVQANDNLELGSTLTLSIGLTYEDATGRVYEQNYAISIDAAELDFSIDRNGLQIPSELSSGSVVELTQDISMPRGKIVDFEFLADFLSNELAEIPITFKSGLLTGENNIQLLASHGGTLNRNDFEHSNNRRKRMAGDSLVRSKRAVSSLSVTANFGDILNPSTGISGSLLQLLIRFVVGTVSNPGDFSSDLALSFNGRRLLATQATTSLTGTYLTVHQSVKMEDNSVLPNTVRFGVNVSHHDMWSQGDAYDVIIKTGDEAWSVLWRSDYVGPDFSGPDVTIQNDRIFTWNYGRYDLGDPSIVIAYNAQPYKDGEMLPEGISEYESSVTFKASTSGQTIGPFTATVCIEKNEIVLENTTIQYGFTILALVFGLLIGALIVFIILFIVFKVRKELPFTSVHPASGVYQDDVYVEEEYINENGKGLVTDGSRKQKGFSTIKNLSKGGDESLVQILALKDKSKQDRELDNLDIVNTIAIDENLDNERNLAMVEGTKMLVQSLRINGDIDKSTEDRCTQTFQKNLADMDKTVSSEFDKEMELLLRKLSTKNKQKLGDILEDQQDDKEMLDNKLAKLPPKERQEMEKLYEQQQEAKKDELIHRLKLEQDEESEKLRKEFAIRRRMGIKGLQQGYLDDVQDKKDMSEEQVDWLMKEHFRTQANLEHLYDDEISRQRMILEEKLARRKALAEGSNQQEEQKNELLNAMASQQVKLIQKAKKDHLLSDGEAKAMIERVRIEMQETKQKMDGERQRQEEELHKKLSDRKLKRMEEMAKKQQQEMKDLEKKQKAQGPVDPSSLIEARQTMQSHQRTEIVELENQLDQEDATELEKLRQGLGTQIEQTLDQSKTHLTKRLRNQGMSDDQLDKLLRKHNQELENLRESQQVQKERQLAKVKERLAQDRTMWNQRKEQEQNEQEALREHEKKVVRNLIDNQVAFSEKDREAIMQEHEKQMVTLENSLTLNKLQQKRMLEEKISQKRAKQMEALQKKQALETKKRRKSLATNDSDDEDDHNREVLMLKKHAEERLAVLHSEKLQVGDEVEDIREEMMRDRANAMKEQEVRLGAMLADLQMQKAKEKTMIEEQQKAINNLKRNLMDDMNERGVLSDPECQEIIDQHQQNQDRLNQTLENQKAKHEKLLHSKLAKRLKQKEEALDRMHDQQLSEQKGRPDSTASKLKRAALMTKHVKEKEQFSQRIEKEIKQTLEEMRRQNEMKRMNKVQDMELQFINGLVRMGHFKRDELSNVVGMLFPLKNEAERKQILEQLCEGYKEPEPSPQHSVKGHDDRGRISSRKSTLEEKALSAALAEVQDELESGAYKAPSKKKKGLANRKKGKKKMAAHKEEEDYPEYDRPGSRAHNDSYDNYDRPGSRLQNNNYDDYDTPGSRLHNNNYDDYDRPSSRSRNNNYDNYDRPGDQSYNDDYDNFDRRGSRSHDNYGYDEPDGYGHDRQSRLPPLDKKHKKKKASVSYEV